MRESGFSSLDQDVVAQRSLRDGNDEGWQIELTAAQTHLEPTAASCAVHLPMTPEDAWRLLLDCGWLTRWYAYGGARIEPVPDGHVELRWDEHGTFRGRVLEVAPVQRLSFLLAVEPDTDPVEGLATCVTFSLEARGEGTTLHVRQSGYERLDVRLGPLDALVEQDRGSWDAGLRLLHELVTQGDVET